MSGRSHNPPLQLTSFIGRNEDKTRLTLQVGAEGRAMTMEDAVGGAVGGGGMRGTQGTWGRSDGG